MDLVLDRDGVQQAAEAALAWLPRLSVADCDEAWRSVTLDTDATCPPYTDVLDPRYWISDFCTGPLGTELYGILTTEYAQDGWVRDVLFDEVFAPLGPQIEPGFAATGFSGTSHGLSHDGTVGLMTSARATPPNTPFALGGQFRSVEAEQSGVSVRYHALEGVCAGGIEPPGSWVEAQLSPWIHLTQLARTGTAGYQTIVDGGLAGLPAPFGSVTFGALTYVDPALGGTCALEPSGTLEVRRDDGYSVVLVFDPATCDGCAEVQTGGAGATLEGELCLDFSVLAEPMRGAP
jgi:hypothetical protein